MCAFEPESSRFAILMWKAKALFRTILKTCSSPSNERMRYTVVRRNFQMIAATCPAIASIRGVIDSDGQSLITFYFV